MKPKLFGDFRDTVARNAEKDPSYAPYCGRCSTTERMRKIERFTGNAATAARCTTFGMWARKRNERFK